MNDVARRECAENCFNNAGRRATAFSSVDSFRLYDLAPWHAPYAPIPSITLPNHGSGKAAFAERVDLYAETGQQAH